MAIDPRKVYGLVLGGGAGKRLFPLTQARAKPAVPLAGKYRLIDIPISNCLNSGIVNVYILTQFNSKSLHRHIHHVYKFDVFSHGFVDVLAAAQDPFASEWYQGTADAVRRNLSHLNDDSMKHVLILSGDQVYRMDFHDVLDTHERKQADITVAVTIKRPEEAAGLGILKVTPDFQVVDFVEKPTPEQMKDLIVDGICLEPLGICITGPVVLASMGIYMFNRETLFAALDNEMSDFGRHVIPHCVKNMKVYAHPFEGYWEDVGTIGSYFRANLEITSWRPEFEFYDEAHPVFTHPRFLPNSKLDNVVIKQSTISDGCLIHDAQITHSVIGVRGIIRSGSVLEDVVMLGQDDYELTPLGSKGLHVHVISPPGMPLSAPLRGIGHDCRIKRAIIDKNARIGNGVVIEGYDGRPNEDGDGFFVRDGIVVVPKNGVIAAGRHL